MFCQEQDDLPEFLLLDPALLYAFRETTPHSLDVQQELRGNLRDPASGVTEL